MLTGATGLSWQDLPAGWHRVTSWPYVGKGPLTASPWRPALEAQPHGTSNSNNTVGGGGRSDNGEARCPTSSPPRKRSQKNQRNQLTRAVSDVGAGLLVADTVLPLLLAPSVAHVSAGRVPPGEQPMQD